jgi:hypothetical protein
MKERAKFVLEWERRWDAGEGRDNGVQFSVVRRPLEPVVHVAGVELRWEARVRLPDDRTFDGYGPDPETAITRAGEAATKGGVLDARLWHSVARALAGPPSDARLAHHLKS